MADDIKALKDELAATKADLSDLKKEHKRLEEAHAQLQTAHLEHVNKLASMGVKEVKAYQYKDDECRPVPHHGVCPICGWDRDTQRRPGDKNKEPHVVAV